MKEVIYCYGRTEKSTQVRENIISYGDTVNEFNEFLVVEHVLEIGDKIYITLEKEHSIQ